MKNRSSRFLLTLFFACTAGTTNLAAQIVYERKYDPRGSVLLSVENVARSKYGSNYDVCFHIMDSLIAHSFSGKIADPYGTLKGFVLYSAWPRDNPHDSVVTGMYRSGQIVWDDYPGTKAGFGGGLLLTRDMNKDGMVEILRAEPDFELMSRGGSGISYLWILSWNGTNGRMINEVDSTTHESVVVSIEEMYDLVDTHHTGVLDIRGQIPEIWQEYFPKHRPATLPTIVYTWNGSKYGYWPKAKRSP